MLEALTTVTSRASEAEAIGHSEAGRWQAVPAKAAGVDEKELSAMLHLRAQVHPSQRFGEE